MQLSDKIKKFSVEQAIDYLNKNPVKNLPKLLDWADTFCAGKFEGQRRAIRKACLDPNDAHYPMVQHILNDVDPGVLKTSLVNFFIYGISSCYTSVNWDAISSEAYFRQLIDLGCLFIWYFHYMPVGNDASPSRQPPRRRKSKKPPIEKAPSPGRETVLCACQKPMRAWEGAAQQGRPGGRNSGIARPARPNAKKPSPRGEGLKSTPRAPLRGRGFERLLSSCTRRRR